jgi:hypothetical protein
VAMLVPGRQKLEHQGWAQIPKRRGPLGQALARTNPGWRQPTGLFLMGWGSAGESPALQFAAQLTGW